MVSFTCQECCRSFKATSIAEAKKAYEEQLGTGSISEAVSFENALDVGEVSYARYCPYCGSVAIEED